MALSAIEIGMLKACVLATHSGAPYFAKQTSMKKLLDFPGGPLVEFNDAIKDSTDANKIAFRASPAGVAFANGNLQPAPQGGPNGPPVASEFALDDGVAVPPLKRGGRGGAKRYPFDTMAIGQSFHIPKTADNPKPSKRIASIVSLASKKLAPKVFKVQAVDSTDKRGEGARVWRLADVVPAAA